MIPSEIATTINSTTPLAAGGANDLAAQAGPTLECDMTPGGPISPDAAHARAQALASVGAHAWKGGVPPDFAQDDTPARKGGVVPGPGRSEAPAWKGGASPEAASAGGAAEVMDRATPADDTAPEPPFSMESACIRATEAVQPLGSAWRGHLLPAPPAHLPRPQC